VCQKFKLIHRTNMNRPFRLSLYVDSKTLTVLAFPSSFILNPQGLRSSSQNCFVSSEVIPQPIFLSPKDMAVIGVLGHDYSTFPSIRSAMRALAVGATNVLGYEALYHCVQTFAENWTPPLPVIVRPQKGIKSEKCPRKPLVVQKGITLEV
jgi:hypothetical protein